LTGNTGTVAGRRAYISAMRACASGAMSRLVSTTTGATSQAFTMAI